MRLCVRRIACSLLTLGSASALAVGDAALGRAWAQEDRRSVEADAELDAILAPSSRFARADSLALSQRGLPGYRSEVIELNYRWWRTAGRADLQVGVRGLTYVTRPGGDAGPAAPGMPSALAVGTLPGLGLRYRASERAALYADATGLSGIGPDDKDRVVGKVGVEFKSAQSYWNLAYGGLGSRLANDSRMSLRVQRRGIGVIMRGSF